QPDHVCDGSRTDLIMDHDVQVVLNTLAGDMELQKEGDDWDIVKPLHTRADDQKVSDMIAQVTTARIQQFVADDRGDLHPYGLAEPHGSLTLFAQNDKSAGRTDSSRGETGQTLQIGGPATAGEKEQDQVYVR